MMLTIYWFKVNNYKIKNTEINNYFYLDRKFSVDLDTKEDLDLLEFYIHTIIGNNIIIIKYL